MKVCILGMGYVGLTLAVHLAQRHEVIGVEIDPSKRLTLQSYVPTFGEYGLDMALSNVKDTLRFTDKPPQNQDVYIIAVGTPKGGALKFVEAAIEQLLPIVPLGTHVILRSTVPVGTTKLLSKKHPFFYWTYAPERTVAGNALAELRNHTQLFASLDAGKEKSYEIMQKLFPKNVEISDTNVVEAVKLLDNSWRDNIFAFANAFALEGEKQGFNAWEAISAAKDYYDRTNCPAPGFVGGTCLTKDPSLLFGWGVMSRSTNESIIPLELLRAGFKQGASVGVLGVAFKASPLTTDTRDGPLSITRRFVTDDTAVRWYDPQVPGIHTFEEVLECDYVIIANNNPVWRKLDYSKRKGKLIDLWNSRVGADYVLGVPNAQ